MPDVGVATLARGERDTFGAQQRSRWSPDWVELELIRSRRRMGAGWNAIAAMLGRPVCDVRAAADPTFDKAFAYPRTPPAASPPKAKAKPPAATRASRSMRDGRAWGDVTVSLLECLRNGLVTTAAIAGRMHAARGAISTRLAYCVGKGWAVSRRQVGEGIAAYRLTPAGKAKIEEFRGLAA